MKKYLEIKNHILERIKEGKLEPLSLIETEKTLCESFDVSRMTVRRALDELVAQGILYRVQGKGTFVSPAKRFKEFHRLLSFTEEAAETGLKVKNVITALYTAPPDVALCSIMNTTPQNTITHVNRVRMVNNEPLAYEESCFATSIIGDIDESTLESPEISGSIYRYLEQKKKVKIAYGHQNLSAVSADNKLSIMLAVPEGTPLLKMTLTGHTSDDRVFEYAHTYYRCDKYTFSQTSYRDKH